jgi:adenine-specific DNA-methyltransferase
MIDFSLPYSQSDFITFLDRFLPEDYKKQEEEIDIPFQSKYFEQATYLGKSEQLNLAVYEVYHTSEHDARVGLTREMFRLMAHFGKRRSLVVLVPQSGNTYRFSLVTIDLKLDENDNPIREYSNPKRYSFILGEGAKLHTPQKFLISQGRVSGFDDLLQRFSVEVVNKEFYNQIAVMFSRLVGGKRKLGSRTKQYDHVLELPSTPYDGNEQKYKEFAVRLIGRTVFCWFLKKKKSANNIPLIPEDVLSTFAISFNPNYYHSRVEPLFFNVLNTPVNERTGEFKEKPYDKIPFLNGGLFEPQPDDFYTGNYPNYALKIPDEWWKDFIEILETYNFTIDENTSIDIDLSVDPEMLGRIFENLLAEINPETGESARKSTGSYYTPRPIVEYMVDESLKQYLVTKTGIAEERLETLLDYSREESGLEPDEELKVIEALNKIKVLDPACGSGAFPMGILQKMLLILQKVDHEAKNSIQQILNDIQDPVYRKLLESKLKAAQVYDDDDLDDYARKLNIIRRSIYGVDIQPVAVDIAKLRFFLSIIVDEVIQDELPNRGIEPLPNLEFKFVCANTLIPLPPNRELFENADFIEKLEQLREQYFISFGEEKEKIKKEFRSVQAQMFNTSIDLLSREPGTHNDRPQTQTQMLATWNPFSNETTKWFDPKWMFGEREGFHVILSNPPYVFSATGLNQNEKKIYKDVYFSGKGKFNLFTIFIEKGIRCLKNNGVITYILPNTLLRVTSYKLIREFLIKNSSISKIVDLDIGIFDNVTASTIIISCEKKINNENQIIISRGITDNETKYIRQKSFNNSGYTFDIFSNDNDRNLISRLSNDNEKLGNICDYIRFGVVITKNFDEVVDYIKKDQDWKPFLEGDEIGSYTLNYKGRFLLYKKELLHRSRTPELFECNKIMVQRITGGNTPLKAVYDENHYYNKESIINIIPKRKEPEYIKFVLSLINSKLLNWIYSKQFTNESKLTVNLSKEYLSELPIVEADEKHILFIKKCVDRLLFQDKNQFENKKLKDQIDLMVYKLYELTYDEALIVDPELPGIISREDYEKAGVEELAEWKV